MPQFDFYSFSSQCSWILISFFLFYFFTLRFYLANYSELLKMRKKLLSRFDNTLPKAINLYDSFLLAIIKSK